MIIFSPGPSNISERVRNALRGPDISHRGLEFHNLLCETRSLVLKLLKVNKGFSSIIIPGSGTLAIESVITSLDSILVISNGIYGERALEIAKTYNIPTKGFIFDWTIPISLKRIENIIQDKGIKSIYIVHNETTTGIINPLREIAMMAKKYEKYLIVDGISSIAGEDISLNWGIDLIIGSFNKCIKGIPGLSFVVANNEFLDKLKERKRRTFYSDLLTHFEYQKKQQMPFTPPIQVFYATKEALLELLEEGLENRIRHFQNISNLLRDKIENMGLKLLLPRNLYSNTITSLFLPEKFSYEKLYNALKEKGYEIYPSFGRLKDTTFRLGTVGVIKEKDILGFIGALKNIIK